MGKHIFAILANHELALGPIVQPVIHVLYALEFLSDILSWLPNNIMFASPKTIFIFKY